MNSDHLTIGVNIINTVANFNEAILEAFNKFENPKKPKNVEDLTHFSIEDNYGTSDSNIIKSIYLKERFFISYVKPCQGAEKALKQLRAMGFDVFLYASPFTENYSLCQEIFEW